jgi:hypothetical protein
MIHGIITHIHVLMEIVMLLPPMGIEVLVVETKAEP